MEFSLKKQMNEQNNEQFICPTNIFSILGIPLLYTLGIKQCQNELGKGPKIMKPSF